MKNLALLSVFTGVAVGLTSCGGSGGGGGGDSGGGMYVQSCTLGCTNGIGGAQVSCGLVNTFQNQDIAIVLSEAVKASSVTKNTFKVFDVVTGSVPPGSYVIDPSNPNRLIFRPKLSFDPSGNPLYGFAAGGTYQVKVPGSTVDVAPYLQSTGGKSNTSRMLCTITTDQGLIDPVPGNPTVSIFVEVKDPITGVKTVTDVDSAPLTNVATESKITFVFNDLMNIGTVVLPQTGQAPFITVKTDPDGNLADPTDQVALAGTYTFNVNQSLLQTTAVFTPATGMPSAGQNPNSPRRVVVDVPASVVDLVGHGVGNSGKRSFVPEKITFTAVTLPPGGEQFATLNNMDARHTGADWGETTAGRLKPGTGGGSGRMGDLVVPANTTMTLQTSSLRAQGRLQMTINPKASDAAWIRINGLTQYIYKKVVGNPILEIKSEDFIADTLSETARFLNTNANLDPEVAKARYWVEGSQLVVEFLTPGVVGNTFTLEFFGANGPPAFVVGGVINGGTTSIGPLSGGIDSVVFGDDAVEDNNLFLTNTVAGGVVPDITVTNGVFDFASIELKSNSVLKFVGANPPRLFARGRIVLSDTATIDITGANNSTQLSDAPFGQMGGLAGPGGGNGGQGADRPDNTGQVGLLALPKTPVFNAGVTNVGAVTTGRNGQGVGGALGYGPGSTSGLGHGVGGLLWPTNTPTETTIFNGMDTNTACDSQQVGGPGSGGAFAVSGAPGLPAAAAPTGILGTSNIPAASAGGDANVVLQEPPNAPGPSRSLSVTQGYLKGGAGGGGGGAHIFGTGTTGTASNCLTVATPIDLFRSHSGAGGGGGGGAMHVVAGRLAQIDGRLDASGGNGGSVATTGAVNGLAAQPGGGGAGGGLLVQSGNVDLALLPNRLDIAGGLGGAGNNAASGGNGGVGIVRLESRVPLVPATVASSVTPIDPLDPTSAMWVSSGTWQPNLTMHPDSFSGAESCFMRVTGNFFSLTFDPDDVPNGVYGWNMDMSLQIGPNVVVVAYRGSTIFGGNSPEQHWGTLIDDGTLGGGQTGAPIIVRFQGARSAGAVPSLCDVDVTDLNIVQQGSLTPWVMHPNELNAFNPPPDMVRFQIVFDGSHLEFPTILGVTNLQIHATPD